MVIDDDVDNIADAGDADGEAKSLAASKFLCLIFSISRELMTVAMKL
jgi:hypothetical protein